MTEVLMGQGDWSLDLEFDPTVLAELVYGRHVLIYWGERLIFSGPITRKPKRSKTGITVAGRNPEYWLGISPDGPVIEDVEFVAGTNKLNNPLDGADDLGLLYWRLPQGSTWTLFPSGDLATWAGAVPDDDIAQADQSFETDPGKSYRARLTVQRGFGTVGRLRLRMVFEGVFDPPNIMYDPQFLTPSAWADVSDTPGDSAIEGGHLRLGPTTKKQAIANPGFESGLDPWYRTAGVYQALDSETTGAHEGLYSAAFGPAGADISAFLVSQPFPVRSGERWTIQGFTEIGEPFSGDTGFGGVLMEVNATDAGGGSPKSLFASPWVDLEHISFGYTPITTDIDVPDGVDHLRIYLQMFTSPSSTMVHQWDDVTATRIAGNRCGQVSNIFLVVPKRSYDATFTVESDSTMTQGDLSVQALFTSLSGRPQLVADLSSISNPAGETRLLQFTISPPSGYDLCQLRFVGTDVLGGSFRVMNGVVRDNDTATVVVDRLSDELEASPVEIEVNGIAPEGVERVHVEVVAEEQAIGWFISNAALERTGATIATPADIIDAYLRNPATGFYLVSPGRIFPGPDPLPYDLRIRNTALIDALRSFTRAVMVPAREWRLNPDNTLDWGVPSEIFEDRALILAPDDLELLEDPETEESAEAAIQVVKVIGAELTTVGNRKSFVAATALNSPGDKVDYYGRPWTRTRLVQDAAVDHLSYARALAAYEARRDGIERANVPIRLSDPKARDVFDVGDSILVYAPDAALEDAASPVEVAGKTVWPKRVRVLDREWEPGPGFRAEVRRPDGSTVALPVIWNDATIVNITVGDPLPDFVSDPQGGAVGNQFLRSVAAGPR